MAHRGWLVLLALALLLVALAPHVQGAGGDLYLPCIVAPGDSPGVPPTATNTPRPPESATPTVRASATSTRTQTPTRTATATRTPTTGGPQQLLLNRDFEQGAVHWEQETSGLYPDLIMEDVGRWSSWGARLGGRYNAEDSISQTVYIPADAQLAFVGFAVQMTTFEGSAPPRSTLNVSLYQGDTLFLCSLGSYDNTDATYMWRQLYSGDLTPYRGQTVTVRASVQTEGVTTFYLDDFTFLVERP